MRTFELGKTIKELGIDTSRKFLVVNGVGVFNKGDILTLIKDDNSGCPYFKNQEDIKSQFWLYDLYYAEEELKEGDMVYVSDKSEEKAEEVKNEKILLRKCSNGYMCIDDFWDYEYKKGEMFQTEMWKYAVPIPKEQPIKEYTMEQLQEKLGEPFKIIK